jgi:hypothetical protein
MSNPLTLYLPIKQDPMSQEVAKVAIANFGSVAAGLDATKIVHSGRLVAIPNPAGTEGIQALMLITVFDGGMNPYLQTFWGPQLQTAFKNLMQISLTPAQTDDFAGFEKWINDNNLPAELYTAYPWTVKQVVDKFK